MAQVDFFLKIDKIKGESRDDKHKDEIQISSVSWGVSNTGKGGFGHGSGSGKADVQDVHVTKFVDFATPHLYSFSFSGKTVGDAKITMRKAGGDSPVEYLVYDMTEVFVSSVSTTGHDEGGLAQESVALNFSKIKITYTIQSADGTAGSPLDVTLDVAANKVS
jgi:type VI secretion system secreted protein Hcp